MERDRVAASRDSMGGGLGVKSNKRARTGRAGKWNEWARRVKAASGSTTASEWILDESWLDRAVMLEAFERIRALRTARAARELREPAFPQGSFPMPPQLRPSRPAAIEDDDRLVAWVEVLSEERALPAPPWIADFLLTLLATTTPQRESELGCINEVFNREVEELGARRACRKYWARTCYFIWKVLKRPFARAIKWGVILDILRRYIS
jgi:hypothetical protein